MQPTNHALAQRDAYHASNFTRFLWWLATAEEELIHECKIDRNRYAITGFAVLGTWLFATLAWTYFFYTVVTQVVPALLLGLFMGGIILGIDRALIKGIHANNKHKFLPLLFRGILAITIGTFMAQPALLYLFNKEIHVQISMDNEQKVKDKKAKQDALYATSRNELLLQKNTIRQALQEKYNEVATARNNFIAETDGSGGSGKVGLKEIAKAKEQEYLKLDSVYSILQKQATLQTLSIDSALQKIEQAQQTEMAAFTTLLNDGFLTRIEALHNLIKNNSAAQFRYYLLVIILVLIELMPVIAKTLLPNGAYDEKVVQREGLEKSMVQSTIEQEKMLKEIYNKAAFEEDKEFIQSFFASSKADRQEKMQQVITGWKESPNGSFDHVWNNIKKDFLTKLEN